jgi:phosphatidylglycerol lysyltransferase
MSTAVANRDQIAESLPLLQENLPAGWPDGKARWIHGSELTDQQWHLVEDYATRFGSQYDAYLGVRDTTRHFFFVSGGRAIVSGVFRGRKIGVFGGILGPQQFWKDAILELMQDCRSQNRIISFFAVPREICDLVAPHGFQTNKFGLGAVVNLSECDWKGKKYEWIRRQTSFCQRQGLVFEEHRETSFSAERWSELLEELLHIEQQFLADRSHNSRLRHVVGEFGGRLEKAQRLFVARNQHTGLIEAFVICHPALGGKRWVLECFRRRPDATRGAITFVLHQIMQTIKAEGVLEADLCMIPFVGCEEPLENDNWLARKIICLIGRRLNWVYDSQGLFHFKSRFRPEFRQLYVSVNPRISPAWIHYLVTVCGFLRINPVNVVRQICRQVARRSSRSTLSDARE